MLAAAWPPPTELLDTLRRALNFDGGTLEQIVVDAESGLFSPTSLMQRPRSSSYVLTLPFLQVRLPVVS